MNNRNSVSILKTLIPVSVLQDKLSSNGKKKVDFQSS